MMESLSSKSAKKVCISYSGPDVASPSNKKMNNYSKISEFQNFRIL